MRIERDTFGPVEVEDDRLWGAQTQRSLENFPISTERMPPDLLWALACVKKAAAQVNVELGLLEPHIGAAIAAAADEIIAGRHLDQFPLVVWQTGSGTQTNMNMNEVLANRGSDLLGGAHGVDRLIHPNDHVNRSQSSNDVFPAAMAVACTHAVERRVLPSVQQLRDVLSQKSLEYRDVIKLGRTHLQDATPLTLGQEISGWAAQLDHARAHLRSALPHLSELSLGGTAVGTGLNAPPEFAERVALCLSKLTNLSLVPAPNKFEAMSAHDAIVFAHGALKTLAAALMKLSNDVRWLASGPRGGIGELRIPENEPGSSIMPGKVNPTQCEAMTMACAQVLGNDVAVGIAGASGNFQLNAYKPLLAHCFLQSCRLLADASDSFRLRCASGIEPNRERIRQHLESSLMLVTALTPHIGYDHAAAIAKKAHTENTSLREAALALGVPPADFDRWVRPEDMVGPRGAGES